MCRDSAAWMELRETVDPLAPRYSRVGHRTRHQRPPTAAGSTSNLCVCFQGEAGMHGENGVPGSMVRFFCVNLKQNKEQYQNVSDLMAVLFGLGRVPVVFLVREAVLELLVLL